MSVEGGHPPPWSPLPSAHPSTPPAHTHRNPRPEAPQGHASTEHSWWLWKKQMRQDGTFSFSDSLAGTSAKGKQLSWTANTDKALASDLCSTYHDRVCWLMRVCGTVSMYWDIIVKPFPEGSCSKDRQLGVQCELGLYHKNDCRTWVIRLTRDRDH